MKEAFINDEVLNADWMAGFVEFFWWLLRTSFAVELRREHRAQFNPPGNPTFDCQSLDIGHDQRNYDLAISVDPSNADHVRIGGNRCGARTIHGGASWQLPIAITLAAPELVLGVPASANADYAVPFEIAVKNVFDNAIPTFTGTVTFTSTDQGAGAVPPAPLTFRASDRGVATTGVTFITPGAQTPSTTGGSDGGSGSATTAVHGLV